MWPASAWARCWRAATPPPGGKQWASGPEWLAYADQVWEASRRTGEPWVPALFGIDAVHGHNNVVGATLFPHNIGLGAARNPELIRKIAEATATEIAVTGLDWTFAPTLAVAQNDRWGRAYESYSEDPAIVAAYAGAVVLGLQGEPGAPFGPGRVIATAKHFLGDGGTAGGKDQGETEGDEAELQNVHAAGYPPAIAAGAQTLMASFSSWRGQKIHGSEPLLSGVVKQHWGFDGFIVGDWNAHGQLPGCTTTDCPEALLAGLDMYMAPDSWRGLRETLLAQARSGELPMARLEDAVRRILRVKLRAGLFDAPKPSERPLAGKWELLGGPEHRALAREAVRQSLVLLKNNGGLLPLAPGQTVLVAGDGADSISKQAGGWTLNWQGVGLDNTLFPGATSILAGIRAAVEAGGGTVLHSPDGGFRQKPDVAIVVFGEDPYAEFQGDLANVDFAPEAPLALLRRLQAAGVPVVSMFLSGRPLWVNPELNASDAFVAAWLPGSEGAGLADVLFRRADGSIAHDFKGRLSFSWPAGPRDEAVNVGDSDYAPLFPLGYGLSYAAPKELAQLSEAVDQVAAAREVSAMLLRGRAAEPWRLALGDAAGEVVLSAPRGASPGGALALESFDRFAQEDAVRATWRRPGVLALQLPQPLDLSGEADDLDLVFEARGELNGASLSLACGPACGGEVGVTTLFAGAAADWASVRLPLHCFMEAGGDLQAFQGVRLQASGPAKLEFSRIGLEPAAAGARPGCP